MDDIIKALKELLDTAKAVPNKKLSDIKHVFNGDPYVIPELSLPSITIDAADESWDFRGMNLDQKTHTVHIRLVDNAKRFFDDAENTAKFEKVQFKESQRLMVGGNTGGNTDDDSIIGIIRNNPQLPLSGSNTCEIAKVVSVNYQPSTDRPFKSVEVLIVLECLVVGSRIT